MNKKTTHIRGGTNNRYYDTSSPSFTWCIINTLVSSINVFFFNVQMLLPVIFLHFACWHTKANKMFHNRSSDPLHQYRRGLCCCAMCLLLYRSLLLTWLQMLPFQVRGFNCSRETSGFISIDVRCWMDCVRIWNRLYRDIIVIVGKILLSYREYVCDSHP